MPSTPVQALQLLQGVESPANRAGANWLKEVPCARWQEISAYASSVIIETREKQRETALVFEKMTIGTHPIEIDSTRGATLIYVEEFDPAINRGYGNLGPYWPYGDEEEHERYVPRLNMRQLNEGGLVLHRHLTWMGGGAPSTIANPVNVAGQIGKWIEDVAHNIYQGDAIFLLESAVSLRVGGANAATLWLVRLGEIPTTSGTSHKIWVDNVVTDNAQKFDFVLGNLLEFANSDSPPVLYTARRPIVKPNGDHEGHAGHNGDGGPFAFIKNCPGVMIGLVEGFVAPSDGDPNAKPFLTIRGDDAESNRIIRIRSVDASGQIWKPLAMGATEDLKEGDAFYVLDSKISLTVNNASVAYLRTAGLDTKRPDSCQGRPC